MIPRLGEASSCQPARKPTGQDPIDTLPIGGADDVLSQMKRHGSSALPPSLSMVLTLSLSFSCMSGINVHRMTHATRPSGRTGRRPAAAFARQIAHAGEGFSGRFGECTWSRRA